jgi:hypothetical protein
MKPETLSQVAVAAPPASAAGLTLIGYPLADWVQLVMLVYAFLLCTAQLPKALSAANSIAQRIASWLKRP